MSSGTSFLVAFVAQWSVALGDVGEGLDLLQTRAAQVTGEFENVDFMSLLQTRAANATAEFEGVDFSRKEEVGGVLRSQVPLEEDDDEGETVALEGDDREGALLEKGSGDDDQAEATLLLQAVEADVGGAEVLKDLKEDGVSDSQLHAVALDCAHKFHDGNDETVISADGMAKILVKEGFDVLQSSDVMVNLDVLAAITREHLGAATTLIQKSVTLDQTAMGKCGVSCRAAAQQRARAAAAARAARARAMHAAARAGLAERRRAMYGRRVVSMEQAKADCLAAALASTPISNQPGTCVQWDRLIARFKLLM